MHNHLARRAAESIHQEPALMLGVRMRPGLALELVAATSLVAISSAVVVFWLLALVLAFRQELEPWNNAGVIMFGLGFVGLAAIPGLLGVMWSRYLAARVPLPWTRLANIRAWLGTILISFGALVAVIALILGQTTTG
jgi:hypothetical protein